MTKQDPPRGQPVLVTGMPRSGTTWLARLLATAPGTALTGREPMNARGRQFALGGTLRGWARLEEPTRQQRRALRLSYAGLHPLVYSRYGARQLAAPLPWTRRIIKDPFAMLSTPVVAQLTGAQVVLLYRHPGAMLASYRRMGWQPDLDEIRPIVRAFNTSVPSQHRVHDTPTPGGTSEAVAMGQFWNILYGIALWDHDQRLPVTMVSHQEIAVGGLSAISKLLDAVGLDVGPSTGDQLSGSKTSSASGEDGAPALHRFGRDPREVASSWQRHLGPGEVKEIEDVCAATMSNMDDRRLVLPAD